MFRKLLPPMLAACLVLAAPTSALAAITGPGEDTPLNLPADSGHPATTVGGGSHNLVRTIVGLAVVIGVIYGVAWVLRQVRDSRESGVSGAGLQHAATIPLGPNRSLHLVRAGRELVLVGSAEGGVVPIRTYTEEEAIAVGLIDPETEDDDAGPRPSVGPGGRVRAQAGLLARLRELTAR